MKKSLLCLSLMLILSTMNGCSTTSEMMKKETHRDVARDIEPTQTADEQTQNETESVTQTEAEMVATDGMMLANSYDLPAEMGIKRFMFEHHPDFSEPSDALVQSYKERLISHGFAQDMSNGGHYLIILTAGEQPKETSIIRKAKPINKPKHSEIDPEHLAIAIRLLESDTALPVKFIVLNVSQKEYQLAQQKIQDPVIFAKLKKQIPNLNRIDFEHDLENIYAQLEIEKKKGIDKAKIKKIAKQILGLEIKIKEDEKIVITSQ